MSRVLSTGQYLAFNQNAPRPSSGKLFSVPRDEVRRRVKHY
jgi:hypothetical protein